VTTLGIVEDVHIDIRDEEQFIRLCRQRSVFTDSELREHWRYRPRNRPFIVDFLYAYSFPRRPNMEALIQHGVIQDVDFRGEKRYEFRRSIFKYPIDVVVVYATVPIRRVVAEFRVQSIIRDSPEKLWEVARAAAGIEEGRFFQYFLGKPVGYAIQIGKVRKYRGSFCPVEQLGVRPPQSFVYLPAAVTS
jgi:predicted transcriptional regulator